MPESSPAPGSEPESEEVTHNPIAYDSVTIHHRAEGEEPLTVERVIRFADSIFPGSGERALQVIDDPRKGPVGGLSNVDLILVPPEEISHITLRDNEKETTATVEEVLGDGGAPDLAI